MTRVYVDASVLLRIVLREPDSLSDWATWDERWCNELIEVECMRTLDRYRITGTFNIDQVEAATLAVNAYLETTKYSSISKGILKRAAMPLPGVLGTLDAIHLATALHIREQDGNRITMATHDKALARASRAMNLDVLGI